MPVIPFIPMIAQGVGSLVGGIAAKKAQKKAMERMPEEQQALAGQQASAGGLQQGGSQLMDRSLPMLGQASNYYSTLLRGNRAAQAQAVSPYAAQLSDVARGESRNLERSGVQGAARDVAAADIGRRRASGIASLVTGMQPAAANALGSLGTSMSQTAVPAMSNAGNLYGNMLGQGYQNRVYGRQEGEKAGTAIGGLIADVGKVAGTAANKKWGSGSGGGLTDYSDWTGKEKVTFGQ